MHVLRDGRRGVECDRGPHEVDVLLGDVMAAQEVARGICTVNLETICVAAVIRDETHVVEQSTCVEKLRIELKTTALPGECAEIVNTAGVIEQQSRFRIADELGDFVGEF